MTDKIQFEDAEKQMANAIHSALITMGHEIVDTKKDIIKTNSYIFNVLEKDIKLLREENIFLRNEIENLKILIKVGHQ